jgi:hypothetical protein
MRLEPFVMALPHCIERIHAAQTLFVSTYLSVFRRAAIASP